MDINLESFILMKANKNVFVYLNGGVGNQMFQYACGRALAEKNNAKLILDTWSGFVRDKLYRNKYQLDPFPIKARCASANERVPIWAYRLICKFKNTRKLQQRVAGVHILNETELKFLPEVIEKPIQKNQWIAGYWQSPKYFESCSEVIKRELMPPAPYDERFLNLAEEIGKTEAVALGIRIYEESPDPSAHAKGGKVKTASDVNKAISLLLKEKPEAKFYIFCTHRSPLFDDLNLPESTKYILPSEGYDGTLENLWLLTQFKHHIFTNSSYYWWGAWLSQNNYPIESQLIFASDNFINEDGLCDNWKRF